MSGSINLQGNFDVGQDSTILKGLFIIRRDSSLNLYTKFEVRHSDYVVKQLKGLIIIRYSTSTILKGIFDVGQNSTTLKGVLIVRQSTSTTLKGVFHVGQNSTTLKGILKVQHIGTPINLLAEFKVKIHFSGTPRNLKSVFVIDWPDEELLATFVVKQEASSNIFSKLIVRHLGTDRNIFAKMWLKYFFVEGWADEKAILTVQQSGSSNLAAYLIILNIGEVDEPKGIVIVRQSDSVTLFTDMIISHSSSINLPKGVVIVRHPASVVLKGITTIRHSSSVDGPKGVLVVQKWAALKSIFKIKRSTSTTLKAVFWTRFPTRLWTNRRYLNGVVSLSELELGDAILEYVIEGVMEDIQGILTANEISYSEWTDITLVPTLIRRATTFGVVASLYARKSRTFRSRIIPTVTPVNVVVTGDDERAMEHWESLMQERLNTYLTTIDVDIITVSTINDEPFFTIKDIVPRTSEEQSWHEWNEQREG